MRILLNPTFLLTCYEPLQVSRAREVVSPVRWRTELRVQPGAQAIATLLLFFLPECFKLQLDLNGVIDH